MDQIQDDNEKEVIEKLAQEYYDKIARAIKNDISMNMHLKTYSKGGKQKEWEIKAKIAGPTKIFESKETDWDLARTLHKVFKSIERQIEHRFKD